MNENNLDAILYECGHVIAQRDIIANKYISMLPAIVSGYCPECELGITIPDPNQVKRWLIKFKNARRARKGQDVLNKDKK